VFYAIFRTTSNFIPGLWNKYERNGGTISNVTLVIIAPDYRHMVLSYLLFTLSYISMLDWTDYCVPFNTGSDKYVPCSRVLYMCIILIVSVPHMIHSSFLIFTFRPDHILQDIVYKLVPGLFKGNILTY